MCLLRLTSHLTREGLQVCVQALAPDGGPLSLATQYGVRGRPRGPRIGSLNYYPPLAVLPRAARATACVGLKSTADYWANGQTFRGTALDLSLIALRAG